MTYEQKQQEIMSVKKGSFCGQIKTYTFQNDIDNVFFDNNKIVILFKEEDQQPKLSTEVRIQEVNNRESEPYHFSEEDPTRQIEEPNNRQESVNECD